MWKYYKIQSWRGAQGYRVMPDGSIELRHARIVAKQGTKFYKLRRIIPTSSDPEACAVEIYSDDQWRTYIAGLDYWTVMCGLHDYTELRMELRDFLNTDIFRHRA